MPLTVHVFKVYLNLANGGYQWEKPEEVVMAHQSRYLTLVDLEDAVMVIMQQEANNKRVRFPCCGDSLLID